MSSFAVSKGLLLISSIKPDEKISASKLSYRTNITYAHTHKLLRSAQSMGVVKIEKSGRQLNVSLTNKGESMALLIQQLVVSLKRG